MATVNITTQSDADFVRGFIYTQMTGAPIDLTGNTMRMGVRKNAADATEMLLLTTENSGVIITDAPAGKFTVNITKAQLLRLPPGQFDHSLIRIATGRYFRIWSGELTHSAGPSR